MVSHTGKFSTDWLNIQNQVFGECAVRAWSLLYPYSEVGQLATDVPGLDQKAIKPADQVKPADPRIDTRIGERTFTTFDGFKVRLTPRYSNGSLVVYEAKYD